MAETEQLGILTGMMLWNKDGKWNNVNPFYGASKNKVGGNLDFAKKVYRDVFNSFLSSFVIMKAKQLGFVKGDTIQDLLNAEDDILNLIKTSEFPLMSGYQELREFKI